MLVLFLEFRSAFKRNAQRKNILNGLEPREILVDGNGTEKSLKTLEIKKFMRKKRCQV